MLRLVLLAALLAPSIPALAADPKDKLADVEKHIRQTEAELKRQKGERAQLQSRLKGVERKIGQLAAELDRIQGQQARARERQQALQAQLKELESRSRSQQALLAKQLRAAYASGNHDYLKLLLNLDQANNLERILTYYQYLNQARLDELAAIRQTQQELTSARAQLADTLAELDQLAQGTRDRQAQLQEQQAERQSTLTALTRQIRSQSAELEQLMADRASLNTLLQEAARKARERSQRQGLKGRKGKLSWPAKGRVQRLFATRRAAGITWKGVIIDAASGSQVSAIADGTVVYADWVKGYGLLLAVDHGDGYLSLYGQNQALLKGVGDDVRGGERIALVGASGGQKQPGLYFEIRHKGKAVNPTGWCR
ncbi:peptidoglycan DD-metalloendopeptidase family protein [Gallaecimonas sp. GXIMD4217]|uniref:murein hydrolase activator EnvC family protein n=1 Tax=Gallaecimonas sp. GXIMD4217 TaxID=3131927 RepID=UPI00311ABB3D